MLLLLLVKAIILMGLAAATYLILNWGIDSTQHFQLTTGKNLSLAKLAHVKINGHTHVMTIRSTVDPRLNDAPVLLMLHGGPGLSDIPFLHETDYLLEDHFIVVRYDQRSTGKSCRYYQSSLHQELSLQQHVDDGIAMSEHLKEKFLKDTIFLVGGSWGAMLALAMAKQRPDLFQFLAVHGTPVHFRPPVPSLAQFGFTYKYYWKHILAASEFSWADVFRFGTCAKHTAKALAPDLQNYNAYKAVGEIQTPVLFIHGRQDRVCAMELIEDYVKALHAPWKKLVWFESSGHFSDRDEPLVFQQTLIKTFLGTSYVERNKMDNAVNDSGGDSDSVDGKGDEGRSEEGQAIGKSEEL